MRWQDRAVCRGLHDLFYVDDMLETAGRATYNELRQICGSCPVRRQCLNAALREELGQGDRRYGFRGGMSGVQRRREEKRRQVTAARAFAQLREAI